MRCKQCESILWQQPPASRGSARCCSECGAAYRPSDFDFVRGKVRFCCPHCATGYYGTSPRGHLEPVAFECPTCSNFIHMDECVLQPDGVADEARAVADRGVPWLEKRGTLSRWFGTVLLGMGEPQSIHQRLSGQGRLHAALLFLTVQSWICVAPYVVCCGSMSALAFGRPGAGTGFAITNALASIAISLVVAPAVAMLLGLVAVCAARLLTPRASPTFVRDVEIACYSSGPLLVAALPVYGAPLVLWWFVAVCIALACARPEGSRPLAAIGAAGGFLLLIAAGIALVIVA
jgi:hypothetical protein